MNRPSDRVLEIGSELVRELEAESALYRAVLEGAVSREAYVSFLIQHHKYIRLTYPLMQRYSAAMSQSPRPEYRGVIRAGAARHAEEERGHDDGILDDLARLWGCDRAEARARVDDTETAPSLRLYESSVDCALDHFPAAIAGLAAVLETVASHLCKTAREELESHEPFEGIQGATRFLADHEEDGDHVDGGRLRIDLAAEGHDRHAVVTLAKITAIVYRDMYRYLDAKLDGRIVAAPELVPA
jgi:hypothetical protein